MAVGRGGHDGVRWPWGAVAMMGYGGHRAHGNGAGGYGVWWPWGVGAIMGYGGHRAHGQWGVVATGCGGHDGVWWP